MITADRIEALRTNLPFIRFVAGWSTKDLGDMLGVTCQTVRNIECGHSKMTVIRYLAIRYVIDHRIRDRDDILLENVVKLFVDGEALMDDYDIKFVTDIRYLFEIHKEGTK